MHFLAQYLVNFFAGYFVLTISFFMLSLVVPRAAFVARSLAAYMSMLLVALYGAIASLILTCIGKQQIAQWATGRAFHYVMRLTTGVNFVVEDPNNVLGTTRPAVFLGNHQTELDVVMLGAMFPKYCSVTAKSTLKHMPFLGWFMMLSGSIFIDRQNSKDARSAMQGAASEIQSKKQSVYMFPEGTRSYTKEPTLLPFKKGAFHLAVQAGVPIVPCVVANYSNVLYVKEWVFRSGNVPVKVLDPIPTKGLTSADVDELVRTTRELMLKELVALTAKSRGQPMTMASTPVDNLPAAPAPVAQSQKTASSAVDPIAA